MTGLSLETGYATELSVPHAIINSFKNLAAIGLETNYLFAALKSCQSGSGSSSSAPKKEAAKVVAVEEPKEEEEDVDLGGGLFGDDGDF